MRAADESIYDVSLATAGFLTDHPVSIVELCSNSALVYRAFASLMYKPSVMKQVTNCCCVVTIIIMAVWLSCGWRFGLVVTRWPRST